MSAIPVRPPATHIEWAKYLRTKIPGETVRVTRHYDAGEQSAISIFTSENTDGIVAVTIGVMDRDQAAQGQPPLATEIILDRRGHSDAVGNIVSTIAFYVIKDGWRVAPGVTFENIVSMYEPELHVKHVLFVPPFQWDEGMTRVALADRTLYPLLAVPITDGELALVHEQGFDALEAVWERKSTDILDWSREGVA